MLALGASANTKQILFRGKVAAIDAAAIWEFAVTVWAEGLHLGDDGGTGGGVYGGLCEIRIDGSRLAEGAFFFKLFVVAVEDLEHLVVQWNPFVQVAVSGSVHGRLLSVKKFRIPLVSAVYRT